MYSNRQTSDAEEMGLGPKKTFFVLFTVVGCIAILFPKIFYPMLMGPTGAKDQYREPLNLLKQERPPYMNGMVHPGMKERGRAIPSHSVPIIEQPGRPGGLPLRPGMIERRPGSPLLPGQPGPNMRAEAYQAQMQNQSKGQGTNSLLLPIYTFGIVGFFIYTIYKIIMKKLKKNQNQQMESDPVFVEKVFRQNQTDGNGKLVYNAIQGIIEATDEQLREIERQCAEKNAKHFDNNSEGLNNTSKSEPDETDEDTLKDSSVMSDDLSKLGHDEKENSNEPSEHDIDVEKRLSHLKEAMHIKSVENDENSDFKSIFLEGELPHDPQILVSATETETKTEKISNYAKELADDEAVILSGKMTISLISLTNNDEEKNGEVDGEQHTTTNNVA